MLRRPTRARSSKGHNWRNWRYFGVAVIQETVFVGIDSWEFESGLEYRVVSTSGVWLRGIVKGDRLNLRPELPSVKSKKCRYHLIYMTHAPAWFCHPNPWCSLTPYTLHSNCALPILEVTPIMLNHGVLLPMRGRYSPHKSHLAKKKDPIVKRGVSQRRPEGKQRAKSLGVYRFKKKSKNFSQNAWQPWGELIH